ncbi:hypothetical protein RCL1_007430 [Eukaryota sp. TZLM3-RCL]
MPQDLVWKYVTVLPNNYVIPDHDGIVNIDAEMPEEDASSKNLKKVQCHFCNEVFSCGSASRIRNHFLGDQAGSITLCLDVPRSVILELIFGYVPSSSKQIRSVSLERTNHIGAPEPPKKKKNTKLMTDFYSVVDPVKVQEADAAVCKFFYGAGIPLHLSRSVLFHDMLKAVATAGAGYQPPNYNQLREQKLDEFYEKAVNDLTQFENNLHLTGASLTTDATTSISSNSLTTFTLVGRSESRMIDTIHNKERVTAEYLTPLLENIVAKNSSIVSIITDGNGKNNFSKAANAVAAKYPTVTWNPCVSHILNNFFKDIVKIPVIKAIISNALSLSTFIKNHSILYLKFREVSGLRLSSAGETRFATNWLVLERLLTVRRDIEKIFMDDVIFNSILSSLTTTTLRDRAASFKVLVTSALFWTQLDDVYRVAKPVLELLRESDVNNQLSSRLYNQLAEVAEKLSTFSGAAFNQETAGEILSCFRTRTKILNNDFYISAWYLNPSNNVRSVLESAAFQRLMLKFCRDNVNDVVSLLTAVRQFHHPQLGSSFYGPVADAARETMDAAGWWMSFGSSVPVLQKIALRLLSQPISACSAERIWSVHDWIHSKRRNRLSEERVKKLVAVHEHQRVLLKKTTLESAEITDPFDPVAYTEYALNNRILEDDVEGVDRSDNENA